MGTSSRRPREESLARVVLVAGLLSAGALVWVATGVLEEPGPAGRAALTRLAGEVADSVRREWERFMSGAAPARLATGETTLWTADEGAAAAPAPSVQSIELLDRARGSLSAADALLSESARLELRDGNLLEALAYAQDACTRSADVAVAAEARLRILQLAAKLGRTDLVRESWAAAHRELDGHELRQGIPYLLLCAFVAGAALPEAERADALLPVVEAWEDGRLQFQESAARLMIEQGVPRVVEDNQRRLLRDRLVALVPSLEPRIEAAGARSRRAVVEQVVGGRPRGATDRWRIVPLGEALFLYRGQPQTRGFFVARASVVEAFLEELAGWPFLDEGCVLDFSGSGDAVGSVVRGSELLEDGALVYDLRMLDPDAIVSAESARVQTTRVALLVAAAFSAFAALTSWRALHRQARLTLLKNRFIASVSHELRTPVASILLMAENLESGVVSDASGRARYHGLIRQEALRLRELVNDVLDFSRLEHGEATRLRCTLVGLRSFADALGEELVDHARQGGADCSLEAGAFPEQAEALMDAEAVRRGMLNLLDNALRHADGAGLSVRLSADGAASRGELVFAVADRGPGIPAARREAVLQPFERLSAGGEGAGLGLAIVRAIAEAHGGRLLVRGRSEGTGAVFEMRLPWTSEGPA